MDFSAKLFLASVVIVLLLVVSESLWSGDNHVHIEQVNSGDDLSITIEQKGEDNKIEFSTDHNGNTFVLSQYGAGNTISWVPYWGSGKSWGGDIDGINNNLNVEQHDGATYGGHIWGDSNDVDVYQHGSHIHYLDIHVDSVTHEVHQEGDGDHYSHIYYYNTSDSSNTDVTQKGNADHNAQIVLRGNQPTTLTLLQQGSTNQSYSLTQYCVTTGGCNISVTQGN